MFPAAMVLPMFNGQPLVSPRPAASASAEIPRVWQCAAHDLHHHHHFVRLRFSRRMPLFNFTNVQGHTPKHLVWTLCPHRPCTHRCRESVFGRAPCRPVAPSGKSRRRARGRLAIRESVLSKPP